jgi:nicotinamidase-related amidase
MMIKPLGFRRMAKPTYDSTRTGLLFVDPYNDFLSEGGKLWPRVKQVAEQVRLIENLKAVVKTVREKHVQVFIVPHHRWEPGEH